MIKEVNQIGTTETYDPSYDFSWLDNLRPVNIIITKNLTDDMIRALLSEECKKTCILHLTCTGWGGNDMEPNVKGFTWILHQYMKLIDGGFDPSHVVLRVDPIIPCMTGIALASSVLAGFSTLDNKYKIKRCRVSVMDQYEHIKPRLESIHFKLNYDGFQPPREIFNLVDRYLSPYTDDFEFESCAELFLKIPKKIGCISQMDIDLINPSTEVTIGDVTGKQRRTCLCPNNKVNIIKRKPSRCPNKCAYCYWKD